MCKGQSPFRGQPHQGKRQTAEEGLPGDDIWKYKLPAELRRSREGLDPGGLGLTFT